jgi:hypothetical protein
VLVSRGRTADDSARIPPRVNTALLRASAKQHIYHFCWYLSLDQSVPARIQIRQPTLVHESLLTSREPRQELAAQVDVASAVLEGPTPSSAINGGFRDR